jgi:hypothetical protein
MLHRLILSRMFAKLVIASIIANLLAGASPERGIDLTMRILKMDRDSAAAT